jgi:hypothetical protein
MLDLLQDCAKEKYEETCQRKRLGGERGARAHRGDRNRAVKSVNSVDSDE